MEDWAEIRRLHRAEGLPIKMIARVLGVSRNTVRSAIASDAPPKYERTPAGSIVDEVEPRMRELLQAFPTMPATVIAERIGWTRGLTVFKERVAELRPVYLPPDPAGRTTYVAGEIAQCDLWFPPINLPVGFGQIRRPALLPVLTMSAVAAPPAAKWPLTAVSVFWVNSVTRVKNCESSGPCGSLWRSPVPISRASLVNEPAPTTWLRPSA